MFTYFRTHTCSELSYRIAMWNASGVQKTRHSFRRKWNREIQKCQLKPNSIRSWPFPCQFQIKAKKVVEATMAIASEVKPQSWVAPSVHRVEEIMSGKITGKEADCGNHAEIKQSVKGFSAWPHAMTIRTNWIKQGRYVTPGHKTGNAKEERKKGKHQHTPTQHT